MTEHKNPSGYVIAGIDTYGSLLDRFEKSTPGYITGDNVSKFMGRTVNKGLYSFGTGLSYKTKKIPKNQSPRIHRDIQKIRGWECLKNTSFYLDSGGFQVSMGAIQLPDIPIFSKIYYQHLDEFPEDYDKAFILDVPPGPGSDTFSSVREVYEANLHSYQQSAALSQSIKDKVIYIHHFRTPQIYKIWNDLLFKEDLAEGYTNFSTGGLVAYGASDTVIPAVIYTIPLSSLVRYAKMKGLKSFNFHILGGAHIRDVFVHQLFAYHIKQYHGIEVNITYDSSSIFKQAFNARFVYVKNKTEEWMKMFFHSKRLGLRWEDGVTIGEKFESLMNDIARKYDFKEMDTPIYSEETGTLHKPYMAYTMFYVLEMYYEIERISKQWVKELYPIYLAGDTTEFDRRITEIVKILNQGRLTKKQRSKSFSVFNSLKILEQLDEEYSEHFVNKFMGGDDSAKMYDDSILSF